MAKVIDNRKTSRPNALKPWTCRYMLDGKTKERSFATKGEADDFAADFHVKHRTGTFVDPRGGKVTFGEYAAQWISELDVRPNTRANYASTLRSLLAPELGPLPIDDVAVDKGGCVSQVIAKIKAEKAAQTANVACVVVKGAVAHAVRKGKIPANGHALDDIKVKRAAGQKATIIPATREQLETIAEAMPADLRLTVWLMRACGLRVSEALAVRLDGFRENGHGRTLYVDEQLVREPQKVSAAKLYAPLKDREAGEGRDIPVPSWLWVMVEAHVSEHGTVEPGVTPIESTKATRPTAWPLASGYLFPPCQLRQGGWPAEQGCQEGRVGRGVHASPIAPPVRLRSAEAGRPDHRRCRLARAP